MLRLEPITFSAAFGLPSAAVLRAGAVDVTLNCDTKLFVDPLLLAEATDKKFRRCASAAYQKRFEFVIKLLKASKAEGDKAWRAAKRELSFPEMRYTHLGYSGGRTGSGFGSLLTDGLVKSAKEVIELGIEDPDLFVALALFEDKVGADRISDMTTQIILPCLVSFTQDVAKALGVPLREFTINELPNLKLELPLNPCLDGKEPVLLVPHDVVRDLPVASDWDSVGSAARETQDIRDRVNAQIGDIWSANTKNEKKLFRERLVTSKKSFETFLEVLRRAADEPYDIEVDHNGELYPSDVRREIARSYPLDLQAYSARNLSIDEADEVVRSIILQFQRVVETNGLWRLLWNEKLDKPRREKAAQQVFFAVANSYCVANNLDLTPEANAGEGPVDFKMSSGNDSKILVEIKKSSNSALVTGYTDQLEIYKESEQTKRAHYVIVDVGGLNEAKRRGLTQARAAAQANGDPASEIWYVEGTPKESASKRVRQPGLNLDGDVA